MELLRHPIKTIIYFHFCCKKSATECHQITCTASSATVVSCDTVKVWYRRIKNNGIQEAEFFSPRTDVDGARLREFVEEDQYSTTKELTKELDFSTMPISRTMINLTYKFNRWVSYELNEAD